MSKIIRKKIPIEWYTLKGSNFKRFVFTTTTKRTTMMTSPMMMPAEIIKSYASRSPELQIAKRKIEKRKKEKTKEKKKERKADINK